MLAVTYSLRYKQELEDCRRETEDCRERDDHRDREVEELAEKEAEERSGRREAETELEHLRVSHRYLKHTHGGVFCTPLFSVNRCRCRSGSIGDVLTSGG